MDLGRSGSRYFVTVLAAGFDALVNERANAMAWPHGQMRYNLATLAEPAQLAAAAVAAEAAGARALAEVLRNAAR